MTVTAHTSADGREVMIRIQGRFDFSTHREFREATTQGVRPGARFVVDLAGAEYMDSAALGMLLILHEEAGGSRGAVHLINARPEIQRILQVANFQKMFLLS